MSITTSSNTLTKPILKWVGGKTQIIQTIINSFPTVVNNYHEPFLGGGSVLLAFLNMVSENKVILHGKVYAYDLNEPLIYVYKNIQNSPEKFYDEVKKNN